MCNKGIGHDCHFAFEHIVFSVDATHESYGKGKMINDAPKGDPKMNCKMVVVEVDRQPRLCLFATKTIEKGEELRYDYGVPTLPWRKVYQLSNSIQNI